MVQKNDSSVEGGGEYKGFIIDLMDEVTKDMADVDYQGRYSTTFFKMQVPWARVPMVLVDS